MRGLAAGVLPLDVVVGIAIAADPNPIGWVIAAGSFVPFFYLLSWANESGRLALLQRRALRVGLVEGFRRVRGDETARRLWDGKSREDGTDGEEGSGVSFLGDCWSVEERFEEALARVARRKVESFECVGRDGAVLWVEGRPVRKTIAPPVWEVAG